LVSFFYYYYTGKELKRMNIAVGLSGGIDSSLAAYLLRGQGHELVGLTMKIWDGTYGSTEGASACFGPDETGNIEDAEKLCHTLGIPFHVIDLAKEYNSMILHYFRHEYCSGRTPNPCMKCNQMMKFDLLPARAKEAGIDFDMFATGHYANTCYDGETGRYLLKKGIDEKKEQSYFLALLRQEQLKRVVFPLGQYTKESIKRIAHEKGLPFTGKRESQDFYSGDYGDLLDASPKQGYVVDTHGKYLGRHRGICYYTIGQRRGLGISSSGPLYVIDIDRDENRIVVGAEDDLYRKGLVASHPNWIAIEKLTGTIRVKAKIRYLHRAAWAAVSEGDGGWFKVVFDEPQRAITPGQFVVLYDDDTVVGGGIIERSF
jgi:tRNA-specific 2-thiouridylase